MNVQQFLDKICDVLELEAGSLKGEEALDSLDNWDSLAVISFIALADEELGVIVDAEKLAQAQTVRDLLDLVADQVTA
jgi:acyl carrier protein